MAGERPTLTWRPPTTTFHLAFLVFVGGSLHAASLPGGFDEFFLWFFWGPAGFVWLAWFAMRSRGGGSSSRGVDWRSLRSWLVHPAIAATTLLVARLDWPLALRFHLSRGALEQDARTVLDDPDSAKADYREGLWVGLFPVRRWVEDGVVYYMVDGAGGIMGWGGIAYAHGRPPKKEPWGLGGRWFVWLRST